MNESEVKKLFLENGPTFVHCYHGKDRTGLMVAIIKCKYLGVSADEAIKEAERVLILDSFLTEQIKSKKLYLLIEKSASRVDSFMNNKINQLKSKINQ